MVCSLRLIPTVKCARRKCAHTSLSYEALHAQVHVCHGSRSGSMMKKLNVCPVLSRLQSCTQCSTQTSNSCESSASPSHSPSQRARPQHSSQKRRRLDSRWTTKRTYATVRESKHGPDFRDNMNWPCKHNSKTNPFTPSPYEIFDIKCGSEYNKVTKLKYFELVKIYHPDRNKIPGACEGLDHGERLERVS